MSRMRSASRNCFRWMTNTRRTVPAGTSSRAPPCQYRPFRDSCWFTSSAWAKRVACSGLGTGRGGSTGCPSCHSIIWYCNLWRMMRVTEPRSRASEMSPVRTACLRESTISQTVSYMLSLLLVSTRSAPAWMLRMVAFHTLIPSPFILMSSVMISPSNLNSSRRMPLRKKGDRVAGVALPRSLGNEMWEVITPPAPALTPLKKGGNSTVSSLSRSKGMMGAPLWLSELVSPCPGKCFRTEIQLAASCPRT
mmetsp:Transcript_30982/g.55664  ORF Transcript_30982/g.55664 Transcript_30982/m.55664 type:complete len:250 (-) Transcript_30982:97-846(-)